jgi:hypothetical protein
MNLLPPFSGCQVPEKNSLKTNLLEVSAAAKINIVVFRVLTPYDLAVRYKCFLGTCASIFKVAEGRMFLRNVSAPLPDYITPNSEYYEVYE